MNIANPQLWSCETPSLYTAEVSLVLNGKVVDKITKKFGIRTIEFSKEYGLKLNGKKVALFEIKVLQIINTCLITTQLRNDN